MQIVTLTSDFGLKDSYVSVLKGELLKKSLDLNLIDISHNVASFDIIEGAYILKNAYVHFPEGSIHVISINSYYNQNPLFVIFERDGHYFIGPNNGIFSLLFEDLDENTIRQIEISGESGLTCEEMYSHAVACLTSKLSVDDIGPLLTHFERRINLRPVTNSFSIRATIIHVDHYGNVIINLHKEVFEKARKGRNFAIYFKRTDPINKICKNYGDVVVGETLSIFNSSNLLEIAINMGNASRMLSLQKDETIQIDFIDD
jgi:S-adenosylmethionine hydrolase